MSALINRETPDPEASKTVELLKNEYASTLSLSGSFE